MYQSEFYRAFARVSLLISVATRSCVKVLVLVLDLVPLLVGDRCMVKVLDGR